MSNSFPASGYEGRPDWNDLLIDFGASLFFDGISIEETKARVRGQLCYLAMPFEDISTFQRLASLTNLLSWRVRLAPEIMCLSPNSLAGICSLDRGLNADQKAHASARRAMSLQVFRATGPVIIPPVAGWEDSQELYQIAGSALSAQRPVFALKEGVIDGQL